MARTFTPPRNAGDKTGFMSKYTTIEQELAALKPGESLVVLTRADEGQSDGYFLGIGDNVSSNIWSITGQEFIQLAGLCEREMKRLNK